VRLKCFEAGHFNQLTMGSPRSDNNSSVTLVLAVDTEAVTVIVELNLRNS
jgi:hypothetical protein